MQKHYTENEVIGAVITVGHVSRKIAKVISFEWYDRFGYGIEFIDPVGRYGYWKQWSDGGTIEVPSKWLNCYGNDTSDIWRKYGYKVD